jgi:hypothetical protein
MMTLQITCPNCKSSVDVYADDHEVVTDCGVCGHHIPLKFTAAHAQAKLESCPVCERQDFYKQKDFNRIIGVSLFVIAAILSIWTYGLTLIALYLVDLFLFRKLNMVAVCYKCSTNFRGIANMGQIHDFNHEMHDRIVYSDHDFKGKPLSH